MNRATPPRARKPAPSLADAAIVRAPVTRRGAFALAAGGAVAWARPARADLGPHEDSRLRRGWPRAVPSQVTDRDPPGFDGPGNGRGGPERQLLAVTDIDAGIDPAGAGRGAPRTRSSGFTDTDAGADPTGNGRGAVQPRQRISD
jgi:hypothetical protein